MAKNTYSKSRAKAEKEQPPDYQKLTDTIAQQGGLSTDLRTSADPLYSIQQQGEFWRDVRKRWQSPVKSRVFLLIISVLIIILAFLTIGWPLRYP